ncbi:hypothetical protein FC20_GL001179 [Lactobacillus equicursoris DSM 19284 = JCM 14600 = CIP 110162]|uniref:Uncharacterized protein n=1 Tax=Lactobacillus equicursoris DSM 19284 = JCM 14600 = CIP 110162 TaxID=1293597 RepID=A0A0R1LYN5_9LACO|nr:hypothetical protein FC20_GL001179 [Lactobacillus equicursoris DSM 19284 = JCM 14600 = CIP 110162]
MLFFFYFLYYFFICNFLFQENYWNYNKKLYISERACYTTNIFRVTFCKLI